MPVNWKELINGSNFGSRDSLLTIEGVYLRIRTGSTLWGVSHDIGVSGDSPDITEGISSIGTTGTAGIIAYFTSSLVTSILGGTESEGWIALETIGSMD